MSRRPSTFMRFARFAFLLAGCGGTTDTGTTDTGGAMDTGMSSDTGASTDTGTVTDTGTPADTIPPARDRLMYVSVGAEPRLAVVTLTADGSMSARSGFDLRLPDRPGAMAYARTARRLYIGLGGSGGQVATVDLDGEGRPTLNGVTTGVGNPVYLQVVNGDRALVTAYFDDDRLRSHDASGSAPHTEVDAVDTSDEPHQAKIGPTGDRLYVPHRNGQITDWYGVSSDGALTRQGGLDSEAGAGPRHIAFTPDGAYAYVINEFTDSISAHTVASDGALARFQTITTLPAGFDGDMNFSADVHVTPDGRFVYGSNRGHDSIAMFAIGGDGRLASLGQVSTEARPREIDVSPDGRFVVAAGQDSGALQSYAVEEDGTLTSVDRLSVGGDLRWVIID